MIATLLTIPRAVSHDVGLQQVVSWFRAGDRGEGGGRGRKGSRSGPSRRSGDLICGLSGTFGLICFGTISL